MIVSLLVSSLLCRVVEVSGNEFVVIPSNFWTVVVSGTVLSCLLVIEFRRKHLTKLFLTHLALIVLVTTHSAFLVTQVKAA